MANFDKNTNLIRINKDYAICDDKIKEKTILFNEDTSNVLKDLTTN